MRKGSSGFKSPRILNRPTESSSRAKGNRTVRDCLNVAQSVNAEFRHREAANTPGNRLSSPVQNRTVRRMPYAGGALNCSSRQNAPTEHSPKTISRSSFYEENAAPGPGPRPQRASHPSSAIRVKGQGVSLARGGLESKSESHNRRLCARICARVARGYKAHSHC